MRIYAALVVALGVPSIARAEEEQPTATEVVVTGRRRVDRGLSVERVDDEHIARTGAPSVGETLETLPSLSSGGGPRGERLLTLRGFDQREIAVFVDGVPAYLPYDGQLDLAKWPVDLVSRITVVKGAGSLLYGPNGLGGAISIATRDPTGTSARASVEQSPFRSARGSLVGTVRAGTVGGVVGLAYQSALSFPLAAGYAPTGSESGGDRKNADRLSGMVSSKWVWDASPTERFTLGGNALEGRFGVPPATRDFLVRYWRWPDWYARTLSLSHSHRGGPIDTDETVYASLFGNQLAAYDDARYATQRLPKSFTSVYDDVAVGATVRTAATVNVDARRSLVVRSYGALRHDVHAGRASEADPVRRASTNVLTEAIEGDLEVVPSLLGVNAGMELDGEVPGQSPSSSLSPSPTVGAGPVFGVWLSPHRVVAVSANAAFRTRFPTLRERYSSAFDTRLPNPALGPERATNASLDVVVTPVKWLRWALSGFDSEVTNLIAPVLVAPQTEQLRNVGRARFVGGETALSAKPFSFLELEAGWLVMSARQGATLTETMPYRPVEKGLLTLTVSPWWLSFSATMRHVGAQSFQNPNTGLEGRLGGYQLFDLRAQIAVHGLAAWVRIANLFDRNVEPRFSFPEPGRQLFVGVSSRVGT
jgi:iron complex outermembrane receptor protein